MKRTILSMLALGYLLGHGTGHVRAELIAFDDLTVTSPWYSSPPVPVG
jgi:hypothetical protein